MAESLDRIIIMPYEIEELADQLRNRDQRQSIVFMSGTFDLIHRGHVNFLNICKSLGGILIVGVRSDQMVKVRKGPKRPIISEEDRAYMVSNIKCVDYVFIIRKSLFDGGIEHLHPKKIIFCREKDQDFTPYEAIIKKYKRTYPGIECIILERASAGTASGNSTSKIIEKISQLHGKQ